MSLHWILLVCLIFPVKPSPHQPLNLTWVITNAASGDILNQTTHIGPLGTWFPDLYFDLGLLLQLTWQDKFIQKHHFYVCPAHDQTKADRNTCGGVDSYFCASWSCVSTGHIWWTAPKGADFIKVTREGQPPCPPKLQEDQEGYCNPVKIHFTSQGKNASGWNTGKSWGIRLYEKTRMFPQDPGALFTIQLLSRSLGSSQPLGPNKVLTGIRRPLLSQVPVPPPTQSPDNSQGPPSVNTPITGTPKITSTLNSGPLGLLQATYEVLNSSHPEMTTDCWLCLDTQLPYYEGIAIPGNYAQVPNNTQCRWQQTGRHKITLQMVTGMGLCIGNKVPSEYLPLCNVTQIPTGSGYLIPPDDSWWACSSGLTPCIHVQVMNDSNDFCVLVQLVPRVLYYQGEDVPHQLAQLETRQKRVAIAAILVPTLWGIGLAGTAGLGTSALILQDKNYKALRQAIDADLEEVEKSISHLQESLSLAEVVLQNRRRLDLLFLQQGGLCLALQEQCCFYANHSGVVKEPMAVLRKRLHDRQLEREQSKSWYGMNPSSSGPLG